MAKKTKLKPTPISRLLKAPKQPFKMVGDPTWGGYGRDGWASRERAVYPHEMERKHWPMAWKPEVWEMAWADNIHIDRLVATKWDRYGYALKDNEIFDYLNAYYAAERDNATWDYHHENYLEEVS